MKTAMKSIQNERRAEQVARENKEKEELAKAERIRIKEEIRAKLVAELQKLDEGD